MQENPKAGTYELRAHWDRRISKAGEPYAFVRYVPGDLVELNADEAEQMVRNGTACVPGEREQAAAEAAKAEAERAQAAADRAKAKAAARAKAAKEAKPARGRRANASTNPEDPKDPEGENPEPPKEPEGDDGKGE